MLRRLTPLFGVFSLCCSQLATAEDSKNDLDFNITEHGITVNLADFYKTESCRNRPSSGSLFSASVCVLTPGIDDQFFVEDRPDLGTYSTNKAEDLLNQFKQEELERKYGKDGSELEEKYCENKRITNKEACNQAVKGLYNKELSTGIFRLNFRGLPIIASFPYAMGETGKDGRILVFSVPSLSINKIFVGSDREDSVEQLKDYLKKDGNAILKKLTEISPGDPVAGSQKNTAIDDFAAGTGIGGDRPSIKDFGSDLQSLLGIGFRYETRTYDGNDFKYIALPLSARIPLGSEQELIFRLPLQYTEVNGDAKVYQVIGGISYKAPVAYSNNPNNSNRWFLMPSFSYGITGSEEMASVAQIVSTSLTSEFLLVERPNYSISIGNLIGYSKTLPFKYKDWDLSAERANTITRNGVLVSLPFSSLINRKILGMEWITELFVIDTRAFGDPMHEDQFNEIGFSIGPKREKAVKKAGEEGFVNVSRQQFGLGFRYFHSAASHGLSFSIGYEF